MQTHRMKQIVIISSSVRKGRASHRIALFFEKFIKSQTDCEIKILDLKELNFPIFPERLKYLESPDSQTLEFAESIKKADGVLIVTPEYNGGYPASLKNVVDLLIDEWKRKPVAISTVSGGAFGGSQVITSLSFVLWKMGALLVPAQFLVPQVSKEFQENGEANNLEEVHKRANRFIQEFIHWIDRSTSN